MQQISSQCTNCGAFTRRSQHHEKEYESSVLLERLRTTNFPATDQEITHIRHTILPTISDDISSIDSKVTALREVIMSMEEERERLINVQKRYNNLVSLHRTLPSEILSTMFLYTISENDISYTSYTSDSNAFNASGSMWLLSHVCQRWRNVVLSLRSFWSTIDLCFPQAAQAEGGVQRLEAVLQRSRRGPLDVYLESDRLHDPRSDPSVLKRLLAIVLEESSRWRLLHLADDDEGSFNMIYAQLHNHLPQLQSMHLHDVQLEPNEQSVFEACPRLTNLSLGGSSAVVDLKFPWDQITELDLSSMDSEGDKDDLRACMRLIGLCTSLQTLSTNCWDWEDGEDESPYPPATCSTVRKLQTTSVRLIEALTLPCLREAVFNHEFLGHIHVLYSFRQLLVRSNCLSDLTCLSLAGMSLAASEGCTLHSFLSQTHSLTSLDLTVHMQEFDDETDEDDQDQIIMLLKSLEVKPTKTVTFLPRLASLDIEIYEHPSKGTLIAKYFKPVHRFASLIKVRWKGDASVGLARLRTFHYAVEAGDLLPSIYWDAGRPVARIFDKAQDLIFTELVDEGMDLVIRVTSDLLANGGGNNAVFAVPS